MPTYVTQLDGKILPNAHAIGDVDGDDATELIFGSITGNIAIFKVPLLVMLLCILHCAVRGMTLSIGMNT